MKKPNRVKTKIVSVNNDLDNFFQALNIVLGEKVVAELWEEACLKNQSEKKSGLKIKYEYRKY